MMNIRATLPSETLAPGKYVFDTGSGGTYNLATSKEYGMRLLLLSCLFNHHAVKLEYDIAVLFGVTQTGRASK